MDTLAIHTHCRSVRERHIQAVLNQEIILICGVSSEIKMEELFMHGHSPVSRSNNHIAPERAIVMQLL